MDFSQQINIFLEEARLTLENDFSAERLPNTIQIYKEAIEQYPDASPEPYIALGFLALRAQLYPEAQTLLKQAARLEPFNQTVRQLLSHLNRQLGGSEARPPSRPAPRTTAQNEFLKNIGALGADNS